MNGSEKRRNDPAIDAAASKGPAARLLMQGEDWRACEYICTAGPGDRPFEERHQHVTIAAVIEGSFKYRAGAGKAILHPGTILLGNAGACYECGHDHSTGDRCVAFHFAPDYFAEIAATAAGSSALLFSAAMLPASPRILPWLVRFEEWASIAEPSVMNEVMPRLVEAMVLAISGAPCPNVRITAREEKKISEVLHYIELHADYGLSLGELAGVAAMSKYHFLRTFQRIAGATPYQYVLGARMRRAAVRIATTAEAVSNIAIDCGFGDVSTFNNRFRNMFGVSPTAYRLGKGTV